MKGFLEDYCKPYWFLVLIRIAIVFVPQTGYIHPDEYFQSIEVMAGHFFHIEVDKPWEFNMTFPIRSVGANYFVLGSSYKFLQFCNFISQYFNINLFTPYSLIVFPRLFMSILSFIVDYTIHKLCTNNNEKYKSKIIILASSYVMIVYATHTFSNVIELVLLSLLLYYVTESMTFTNIVVRQHEYLNKRYKTAKTPTERAKIHKLRLILAPHSFKNCFIISAITVIGFFNRPTFLAFALCPIFFWLYRGIGFKSVTLMQFHYRILSLLLCSIPIIILFVLIDSLYFGYLSLAEIEFMTVNINNFVFTPLNFLKYNMNSGNLALHGLHPKYLHFLVNLPLLFNILVIFNAVLIFQMALRFIKRQWHYLPSVRSIKGLMITTFIVPVLLLSIFPHQEPRFILPVIMPLVYLHAENILPEHTTALERKQQDNKVIRVTNKTNPKHNYTFIFWLSLNALLTIFYGFIHQGGIYPAINQLSNKLKLEQNMNINLVTSHIYSIPESLFMQKSSEIVYSRNNTKFKLMKRVNLYQEGSKPLIDVLQKINVLKNIPRKNSKLYFLYPLSLEYELMYSIKQTNYEIQLTDCISYFPHLSVEAFPNFFHVNFHDFSVTEITNIFYMVKHLLSLQLCKIK